MAFVLKEFTVHQPTPGVVSLSHFINGGEGKSVEVREQGV